MENLASNLNQLTLGSTCPPRNQPDLGDLFANLSPELRLDIFEMAAAEPRIVNVGHRYGRMVCMDFTPGSQKGGFETIHGRASIGWGCQR